jgi:hypothetical protein
VSTPSGPLPRLCLKISEDVSLILSYSLSFNLFKISDCRNRQEFRVWNICYIHEGNSESNLR